MKRSESLEAGSSAQHLILDSCKDIVGVQRKGCAMAFDLVEFVS